MFYGFIGVAVVGGVVGKVQDLAAHLNLKAKLAQWDEITFEQLSKYDTRNSGSISKAARRL